MDYRLREECALYFPTMMEEAIECKEIDMFELILKLPDGTWWSYYRLNNTMRRLPLNSSDMSEQEVRRELSLRMYRKMQLKGISQKELSERTGLSLYSINKYLNKKATPSFYAIDRIAKALGCSVDEFRYI